MDTRGPEKKERLLAALDEGMVMIHLDARRPGVLVPTHLRTEAHLRLNLSYRFDPPDLSVGDWGVRCTLSFGGSRFKVAVPWSALFAIASHATKEFWMYPEDMPPELIQAAQAPDRVETGEVVRSAPTLTALEGRRERGPLRAVQPLSEEDAAPPAPAPAPAAGSASEEEGTEEPPHEPPPRPSGRGHLRVVK